MRRQEEVLVALSCVDVMHHDEEAGTLQLEIGIDVHDGVGTDGNGVLLILQIELLNRRRIGRGVVLGEDAYIGTKLQGEYLLGNLREDVEVMVEVERR